MPGKDSNLTVAPSDSAFYKELLDHMSDGVYFVDRDRRILYWNEGAFRLSGYAESELVGRHCNDNTLCHVDDTGHQLCQHDCPLAACIDDGRPREAPVFLRHKHGRRVPVRVRVAPIRGTDGAIVGAVEIFSDNSEEHAAQRKTDEMKRLAFLDQVTQLPNRRYLEMSLQSSLGEYQIHKDPFGLLVIDLDHFKGINDSFGHASGDRALQEVAKTLTGALRTSDIVGRWGGDEFIALVRHVDNDILVNLGKRCCALVAQTSLTAADGSPILLSISTGGTLVLEEDTIETLIKRADSLMYRSKTSGRGRASVE